MNTKFIHISFYINMTKKCSSLVEGDKMLKINTIQLEGRVGGGGNVVIRKNQNEVCDFKHLCTN